MRIEAVVFDMDGLMLDTEPLYRAACQQAAKEFGYTLSDAVHSQMIGRSVADSERAVMDALGPGFPMDDFRDRRNVLEAAFQAAPVPKKHGLDELLALLDSRHIPKTVATSTRRKNALSQLAASGILDRFDAIAAGDEVSNGKPAPDLFLLAAQRLNISPDACLVLEDAEPGIIAASRAGMQVYMVPDLHRPSPTTERLARGIFDSLAAVAKHLDLTLQKHPAPDQNGKFHVE